MEHRYKSFQQFCDQLESTETLKTDTQIVSLPVRSSRFNVLKFFVAEDFFFFQKNVKETSYFHSNG